MELADFEILARLAKRLGGLRWGSDDCAAIWE
jgi:hypothetical protein